MSDHGIPALDELRESLRGAARRDIAARPPARRGRRRALALVLVLAFGGAAAAGAADLISSGSPLPDERAVQPRYQPGGPTQLAVVAHDSPLAWGVKVYTSKHGLSCAVAGQVRGVQLGEMVLGKFRPYDAARPGFCGDPTNSAGLTFDTIARDGRTVIYGRARPGAKTVTAKVDGRAYRARTGDGGAFVFVFKGSAPLSGISAG